MGQHDTQNTSVKNEGGKERVLGWCVDGRGDAGVQCGNAELAGGVEVERRVLHVGKDATEASGLCGRVRVVCCDGEEFKTNILESSRMACTCGVVREMKVLSCEWGLQKFLHPPYL
jgi:hypothetical protein